MRMNEKPAILLLFFILAAILPCYAQEHGNLTGRVVDQKGVVLPGASVVVEGSTLGTSTDLNGIFTLRGVPVGEKKITVEYLGYMPFSLTVTIEKGKTINRDFKLTETTKTMKTIVVSSV